MIYIWTNEKGQEIAVSRRMDDYDIPPKYEECKELNITKEEFKVMNWVKKVTGGAFTKGFGLKGYWVILLGLLIGCGPTYHVHKTPRYKTVKNACTVKVLDNKDALVVCPDGSHALVKAKKVKDLKDSKETIKVVIQECKKKGKK